MGVRLLLLPMFLKRQRGAVDSYPEIIQQLMTLSNSFKQIFTQKLSYSVVCRDLDTRMIKRNSFLFKQIPSLVWEL